MEQQSSMEDLKRIRSLMERSSVYHSLSGLSGVAAGVIGIVVYFAAYAFIDPILEKDPQWKFTAEGQAYLIRFFSVASIICLALAFSAILYFNRLKAQQTGLPLFDETMKKMFINLFIPLISGGIYCIMLIREQNFLLIAPSMLIFYGLAMIMASRHTIIEIRHLGFAELILGLIAIFFKEYGMWFWLSGFGLVNVIYGAYIYFTYERKEEARSNA